MIKRITMRKCATYDDTGVVINDCDRVNFIYGHNGSGKSTISNFLNDPSESKFAECLVEWEADPRRFSKTSSIKPTMDTTMTG